MRKGTGMSFVINMAHNEQSESESEQSVQSKQSKQSDAHIVLILDVTGSMRAYATALAVQLFEVVTMGRMMGADVGIITFGDYDYKGDVSACLSILFRMSECPNI